MRKIARKSRNETWRGKKCGTRERDTKSTESVVEIPEGKSHFGESDVDGR
jgi:hypothetical protein